MLSCTYFGTGVITDPMDGAIPKKTEKKPQPVRRPGFLSLCCIFDGSVF